MRSLPLILTLIGQPVFADVPRVVTDIPVVQSLVAVVMGDLGTPDLLLDKGADAHDFQLRPSQRAALAGAGVVIWMGPAMAPWLDRALAGASPDQNVALLEVPGTKLRDFEEGEDAHEDEHTDEEAHADADGHDHSGIDPHAWMDPDNAVLWLDAIAETLARQDGEHSGAYLTNAAIAKAEVLELAATVEADLAAARPEPIVVAHNALGYFADRFGLTIAASVAEGDAAAPGAARLSQLRALLESGGAACIFPEAGTDPRLVETLAEGTPARVGRPLDPEGRGMEAGPDLYAQILTGTAMAIRDCLTAAP